MADAIEINPAVGGSAGKKVIVAEVTLVSGALVVSHPLDTVEYIFVTEKAASASGEKFSAVHLKTLDPSLSDISVDSSNASSTATVSVLAIGY